MRHQSKQSINKAKLAEIKKRTFSLDEALCASKNAFKGKTALVITAGPSIRYWEAVYNKYREIDPLIVCVKQAVELSNLSELCDIHFVNPYNVVKYPYNPNRLTIFTTATDAPPAWLKHDIKFTVQSESSPSLDNSLAVTRDYESWTIEKSREARPWGPGIMYESVFYTLIHMGITRVVTVGWDIADDSGKNQHFYDKPGILTSESLLLRFARRVARINGVRFFLHILGRKYNRVDMLAGEPEVTAGSVSSFKDWLITHNVDLIVYSDSKWMEPIAASMHDQTEHLTGRGNEF